MNSPYTGSFYSPKSLYSPLYFLIDPDSPVIIGLPVRKEYVKKRVSMDVTYAEEINPDVTEMHPIVMQKA